MRAPVIAAALLVVHIGAWSIPFLTKSDSPYLHPLSPAESDPSPARAKRQAYQVYVDDDVSVTVDKSGKAETGNWGQWTPEKQCSRTCGGGVQVEKRQCSGDCTGASTRYVSCNTDPCPESNADFRAEQCSKYDDQVLDGNYYKWVPYSGKNKCELLCKPSTDNFYYKWDEKVVDGTKCDSKSDDICVDGVCLPLGCDGKLGSEKKADKCGVCDGDGSTCKTIEGMFDERNLSPGYHDIIKLPAGATNIKIEEMRDTSNNLALKNDSDHFFLNGKSMLSVEKDVEAAGTVFEYDDAKREKLFAKGPLKEDITVSLLFRKGNKDSAIKYEFSVPLEEAPYYYKPGDWSACSVTCGKGVQLRTPYCVDAKSQGRVEESFCEEQNVTKPEHEKECQTVDCDAEWFEGDWEQCSSTCGNTGERYRVILCHQVFSNGFRSVVDDANCTAERPALHEACNRFNCPEWHAGPWSACSEKCGDAHQYRSVTCRSEKEGEEGKVLAADACGEGDDMEDVRTCNLGPCDGLKFHNSEWKLCEKCNDTEETREVTCKDTMGRAYPLEKCLTDNTTEIPIDTRSCATVQPCVYEWTTSAWSKCSTECGHGHKSRKVFCSIHQLGDLEVVDESHCQDEKPETRENCTNEEKCTGTWFASPWSQCSEECGGGSQNRSAVCLNYDNKPVPEWCDESEKPKEEQECNVEDCPTCFDSDFGCCPDNSTFAQGEFNEGCSNCSVSEFGCCADNYTEATGANFEGCPEYVESPENIEEKPEEASGEAPAVDADQQCTVTNENGDEASVACGALNNVTAIDDELFGNETAPENMTIHCSKTEFGCCPDWYTPAEGKDNAGCPEFVLGACNGTEYGCCPDDVTLARGPNFEGCGEPSCAAALFGCCKDRRTIAFGPHYAGCERSSFPCELSPFGCCPDGETAALGKNGTGCGENCLTTKYGCCPDGKTVSRGHHNEGCGCEYAQYGCCPDGKSVAKGAGFYGCPDTCAQSQYGCCPDGKTSARGPNKEGCPCQYTRYGCCPDGETTALGPRMEGCDDCRYAKHGCCPDGESKALGPNYQGCPSTTPLPYIQGGTVAPSTIQACALPEDKGSVCGGGYKLSWYYDSAESRCSQFWFGGCDGNSNRFNTKEMCEEVCVEPPGRGRCYLPKMEGPLRCDQPQARYYYDHTTKQCAAFWWRGCLGNANNFESWEECSTFCKDIGPIPKEPVTEAPQPRLPEPTPPMAEVHAHPHHSEQHETGRPDSGSRPAPPTIEEVCRSTADAGPCTDYTEQFFYNAFTKNCETFTYGGCGGNLNRFRTQDECQRRCGFLGGSDAAAPAPPAHHPRPEETAPGAPVNIPMNPVAHPMSADPRRDPSHPEHSDYREEFERLQKEAQDPRRDPAHESHQEFLDERKKAHEERHQKIMERRRQQPQSPEGQQTPGHQQAPQDPRSHPDHPEHLIFQAERQHEAEIRQQHQQRQPPPPAQSNVPAPFRSSGKSREVCQLPVASGKCKGNFRSYYFEVATGQCEQFTYTGCGGNGNRFHSQEECEGLCVHKSSANADVAPGSDAGTGANSVCDEAKETGPCTNFQTKWFYNKADGTCNRFHYGGCEGTGNRFDTEQTCKAACSQHQDSCALPKVQGPCSGKHKNYFFNSATRSCEEFLYGGCLGNMNRFATIEECQARCGRSLSEVPSVSLIHHQSDPHSLLLQPPIDSTIMKPEKCSLPKETGVCKAAIPQFFYDSTVNKCMQFYYGGCGGNDNRFASLEQCENECAPVMHQALTMAHPMFPHSVPAHSEMDDGNSVLIMETENNEIAEEVEESEKEENEETVMEDDPTDVQLQRMEGTDLEEPLVNNVPLVISSSSSSSIVSQSSFAFTPIPELCMLPEQRGTCHGEHLKYRYDNEVGTCVSFMYSGCEPNANNFDSMESCDRACGHSRSTPICTLPMETGHCELAVSKWFFDSSSSECKLMMWSGCGGNGNRFSSREECSALCSIESSWSPSTDICSLPRESGPCKDAVTQWFWDEKNSDCRQFTFGGCRGNGNKFDTKDQCEKRCAPKMESLTLVDVQTVCRLPFEKGPCTETETKWFFEFATGSCKPFTYGGCEGNTNRFDSESLCLSACSRIGDTVIIEKNYAVRAHSDGPFKAGSEIKLTCEANGETPILWFKNAQLLNFDHRITISPDLSSILIVDATPTDSGEYYCAVGSEGLLSDREIVKVNALIQSDRICFDVGNERTCTLTVRMKLCDKKRYFANCCNTCVQAGYPML